MENDIAVDEPGGDSQNCHKCKYSFDDLKNVVQCCSCKNVFHGRCENVDLRGFHLRKMTWKCGQCAETVSGKSSESGPPPKRKRSRVDDWIDQSMIEGIHENVGKLLQNMSELTQKVDQLLIENKSLKLDIAKLQGGNTAAEVSNMSYASVVGNQKNNSKVLLIKQKGENRDVKQIKKALQERVNPVELGAGVEMGRATRDGGLVLSCGSEKEITDVQSEIQIKLGNEFEVDRPKTHEHRIKVVGINECEHDTDDGDIINKVISQNNLDRTRNNFKLKILRKTNVVYRKFNIVFETDSTTYNSLIDKQTMNLGWNRCRIFNDYGIIRCYRCNKYGHLQIECKQKTICAKCSGEHESKECRSEAVKCINCVTSNEKYAMNMNTNHAVWDLSKCDTYKRIEQIQKKKFLQ